MSDVSKFWHFLYISNLIYEYISYFAIQKIRQILPRLLATR